MFRCRQSGGQLAWESLAGSVFHLSLTHLPGPQILLPYITINVTCKHGHSHSYMHTANYFSRLWGVSVFQFSNPSLYCPSQPAGQGQNMAEPRNSNTFTRDRFETCEPTTVYPRRARPVTRHVRYTGYNRRKFYAHELHKIPAR